MSQELSKQSIYNDEGGFNLAIRMAQSLADSDIVPSNYKNKVANCMIALEMSKRFKVSVMQVMQNMYIIQGRPTWGSPFIIGMINASGKFQTDLDFESGTSKETGDWCFAFVGEKGNPGYKKGPTVTMKMAQEEGWIKKDGSKWKTMPELMLNYRAAAFFGRMRCPELLQGMHMSDEAEDMITESPIKSTVAQATEIKVDDVNEMIKKRNEQTASTPDSKIENTASGPEDIAFEEVVLTVAETGPDQASEGQGADSPTPGQSAEPTSELDALSPAQKIEMRAKYNVYVELHKRFGKPEDLLYSPEGFLAAIKEGRLKDTAVSREIPTYSLGDMVDSPVPQMQEQVNNDDLT